MRELLRQRELWGALISVATIAGAVAIFLSPGGSGDSETADGGPRSARIGQPAPNFVVETLRGEPFELASVAGRPVWINVWASWCPPCRAEMPDVDDVQRQASGEGLVFLAMNDGEPTEAVASYIANTGYDLPIGLDRDQRFVDQYKVLGLPTHIFIGADGTLEGVRVGSMTRAEMEEATRSLLAGLDLEGIEGVDAGGSGQGPAAGEAGAPLAAAPDLRSGEAIYNAQCLGCHGGPEGDVRMPAAPPHNGDGHTWHHSDDQLRATVLGGGVAMPAFAGRLTEEQVDDVLAYIKSWWDDEQRAYQEDVTRAERSR